MLTNRRLYTNKPARTLIVDQVNGPYFTLAQAKAAQQRWDVIEVLPGAYSLSEKLFGGSTIAVGGCARASNYLTFTTYQFNTDTEEFETYAHGLRAGDVFRFAGFSGVGTVPIQDYLGPTLVVESAPTSTTVRVLNYGPDETFNTDPDGVAVLCLPRMWYFHQGAVVRPSLAAAFSASQETIGNALTFASWGVVRGHGVFETTQYELTGSSDLATHVDIECDSLRAGSTGGASPAYSACVAFSTVPGDTLRIRSSRIESEGYDAFLGGVPTDKQFIDVEADVVVAGNNLIECALGAGSEFRLRAGTLWARDNNAASGHGGIYMSTPGGSGKVFVTADRMRCKHAAIAAADAHSGADTYYIDIAEVVSEQSPTVSITANIPNTAIILSPRTRLVSEYDNAAGSAIHVTGTNKLTLSAGTMLRPHANATNCVSGTGTIISEGAKATKSKAAGVTVTGTAIDVNSAYL